MGSAAVSPNGFEQRDDLETPFGGHQSGHEQNFWGCEVPHEHRLYGTRSPTRLDSV